MILTTLQVPSPQTPTRPPLETTVESRLDFAATVEAIKAAAEAEKDPVQGVHEMSKILTGKGFPREPLTVVEVCNAKMASQSLDQDIRVALMMPCPITVYQKGDRVFAMTFDTRQMSAMYSGDRMAEVGAAVDVSLRRILDAVKK